MTTHRELLEHLDRLAAAGHGAPCRTWPKVGWISEDPTEQQDAASLCHTCPALTPCREYGQENPAEIGAYGALVNTGRRPPKPARPTTKEAYA